MHAYSPMYANCAMYAYSAMYAYFAMHANSRDVPTVVGSGQRRPPLQ